MNYTALPLYSPGLATNDDQNTGTHDSTHPVSVSPSESNLRHSSASTIEERIGIDSERFVGLANRGKDAIALVLHSQAIQHNFRQ